MEKFNYKKFVCISFDWESKIQRSEQKKEKLKFRRVLRHFIKEFYEKTYGYAKLHVVSTMHEVCRYAWWTNA